MKGELSQQHNQFPMRECHTSEEEESRSSGGGGSATGAKKTKKEEGSGTTDGATIEVVRRPRGRPPGSRNKPKPPIIITRDADSSLHPHILEVPGGLDIVDTVCRFARRRGIGLCILTGTGTVANVILRQPSTTPGATITFHGRFDILSISATIFPPPSTSSPPSVPFPTDFNAFSISLAGAQGQIVGGFIAGPLLAAGTVTIIAASFTSPMFHRLPGEEEVSATTTVISNAGVDTVTHQTNTVESGSAGMSLYSTHLPSHVIWAPTARPQPPPHY